MKKVKCIRNCKNDGLVDCVCGLDNLFICKNCGIEHMHYYKNWPNEDKNILICSFCKIETTRQLEAKQIKLL